MMLLGVNGNNEIVAVGEIPEGLEVIEVEDAIFGENDSTQYKIRVGETWQEITPKYPTQGL